MLYSCRLNYFGASLNFPCRLNDPLFHVRMFIMFFHLHKKGIKLHNLPQPNISMHASFDLLLFFCCIHELFPYYNF